MRYLFRAAVATYLALVIMTDAPLDTEAMMIQKGLPIRMISKVVRGFGRGSSDLGIPTANVDPESLVLSSSFGDKGQVTLADLPTGIYWGFCRIGSRPQNGDESDPRGVVFKAAVSMGFNPTYNNQQKTVEPHLIAPAGDPRRTASSCGETVLQEFYDERIRLSIVGYLRPELPFEGLEKLVAAIKNDITESDRLCDGSDTITMEEKQWVFSDNDV